MLKKIIKFGITGGLGTITNLLLFFVFADTLHINPTIVSFFCFLIACTQNYCINHLWTFRFENKDVPLSFKLWGKFILGSLVGFAINLSILTVLLNIYQSWPLKVIPQGIGILAGMIFNFIFSNFFILKKEKSNEPEN